MSSVKVTLWGQAVGYLFWDDKQQCSLFEWEESFFQNYFSISPFVLSPKNKIIRSQSYEPVFQGLLPCFADSLPDYFGNRVFQVWLEQNDLKSSDLNPLEKLMYIGKRGIGAFEYEPGKVIPNSFENIDVKEIVSISEKIISDKYKYEDLLHNQEALQNILTIGSSVGGAQAKILVAVDRVTKQIKSGDVLYSTGNWDYFIFKLAHHSETGWGKEKTIIEYIYYQMALESKLNVSESYLFPDHDNFHFQTKRFDRVEGGKLHIQTLLGLTGYQNKSQLYSYEQSFLIAEKLGVSYKEKEQLYRQLVFNVAAVNMDDHMKNFAFLMKPDGKWSLAPAYDLTFPFDPYMPSLKFHKMMINGKSKEIVKDDLEVIGKWVGIRNTTEIIKEIKSSVLKFYSYAQKYPLRKSSIDFVYSAIKESCDRL